jgi:hypothetical protein
MKKKAKELPKIFNTNQHVMISTGCGDWFSRVAEKAKETVLHRNEVLDIDNTIAEFDFNDIKCLVDKDTNLEWLERDYMNAHLMDWKQIGTECLPLYEQAVQEELERREKAREKKRKAEEKAYRVKEDIERKLFEEKVKGIEMEIVDQEGYDKWKANQKGDGYGLACFDYAEGWAKLMQKEFADRDIEEPTVISMIAFAENCSKQVDFMGITGFMYGAAVSILAHHWKHGEALRKWHNKEFGQENSDGVVNPAIFTIKK